MLLINFQDFFSRENMDNKGNLSEIIKASNYIIGISGFINTYY
jgi:hypothetical protein